MESLYPWPETRTGPVALWRAYQDYKAALPGSNDLFLFPTEAIYPLDWRRFRVGTDPVHIDEQGKPVTSSSKPWRPSSPLTRRS